MLPVDDGAQTLINGGCIWCCLGIIYGKTTEASAFKSE